MKAPGVLISHTVRPYLGDFASVVSSLLRVTCTPNSSLMERLLGDRRSPSVPTPPSKLIKGVFDREVWCRDEDALLLKSFTDDLIGLRRKSFLAAMKAIRTYVTGLHRMIDDLELAYTLFVAAIESLVQDFDDHEGNWNDLDGQKREKLEEAFDRLNSTAIERIKAAIVETEHLALTRRFPAGSRAHSNAYV